MEKEKKIKVVHVVHATMAAGTVPASIECERHKAVMSFVNSGVMVKINGKNDIWIPCSNIKSIEFE